MVTDAAKNTEVATEEQKSSKSTEKELPNRNNILGANERVQVVVVTEQQTAAMLLKEEET
jgi:hypothetical protein